MTKVIKCAHKRSISFLLQALSLNLLFKVKLIILQKLLKALQKCGNAANTVHIRYLFRCKLSYVSTSSVSIFFLYVYFNSY